MDAEKGFRMTGGSGNTSYAKNSSMQKEASDMGKHIRLETIQQHYISTTPTSLRIADLGCSSGPNTLSFIKDIIEIVEATSQTISRPVPQFLICLNDLPTNDFDSIFKQLPDFYEELNKGKGEGCSSVFVAAFPGSFYGRLFPNNFLHFAHSSFALHWLSKVPQEIYDAHGKSINKGSINISEKSPPQVCQAYLKQYQKDWSLFLRSRSQELITGGRMMLIFQGREGPNHVDRGSTFYWELLARAFDILVSQGHFEVEKLDSYDIHFYAASKGEIEDGIKKEGSFEVDQFETIARQFNGSDQGPSHGKNMAAAFRAMLESMIIHHFGEGIDLDHLFDVFAEIVDEEIAREKIKDIIFFVVLRKL
ncbi:SAM dependent carboxyl methyltransferase [Dillenia turbinata]|uniref:SAM dependent carboxyl methyltransferase n=1 Tax=Dillenia turbinata TaxID=194707 RepID=A0AAN8Z2X5_9MAGN